MSHTRCGVACPAVAPDQSKQPESPWSDVASGETGPRHGPKGKKQMGSSRRYRGPLRYLVAGALVASMGVACNIFGGDDDDGGSSGGPSTNNGTGGSPNVTPSSCKPSTGADACEICYLDSCCDEVTTCEGSSECQSATSCIAGCSTDSCVENCVNQYPSGSMELLDVLECMDGYCSAECGSGGSTTGGGECTPSVGADACEICTADSCCDEMTTCEDSADCIDALYCLVDCSTDSCAQNCVNQYPAGSLLLLDVFDCMDTYCSGECG